MLHKAKEIYFTDPRLGIGCPIGSGVVALITAVSEFTPRSGIVATPDTSIFLLLHDIPLIGYGVAALTLLAPFIVARGREELDMARRHQQETKGQNPS